MHSQDCNCRVEGRVNKCQCSPWVQVPFDSIDDYGRFTKTFKIHARGIAFDPPDRFEDILRH